MSFSIGVIFLAGFASPTNAPEKNINAISEVTVYNSKHYKDDSSSGTSSWSKVIPILQKVGHRVIAGTPSGTFSSRYNLLLFLDTIEGSILQRFARLYHAQKS
jgi:hypothetical protein